MNTPAAHVSGSGPLATAHKSIYVPSPGNFLVRPKRVPRCSAPQRTRPHHAPSRSVLWKAVLQLLAM